MTSPTFTRHRVNRATGLIAPDAADRVAAHLAAGQPAVIPTDTGYMLSVAALHAAAVESVYEAKGRAAAVPVSIACSTPEMAMTYGEFGPDDERVLRRLLPGPLSVVVPATTAFTTTTATLDGTLGIRVPECAVALQIIAALGEPVTATSLNRSGEPPIDDPTNEALTALDWPGGVTAVAVVDDPEARRHDRPSTIVRLGVAHPEILRPGPVSLDEIVNARVDRAQ